MIKQLQASIFMFFLITSNMNADITTDGTVGAIQTILGPDFLIQQGLGTTKGTNLFHSFETFSIDSTQSVTFTGSNSVENIISRVTGGEISNIDGNIISTIGNANFYFFNPSGIVIGPNASFDVPAALHISTADTLTLEDGTIYDASNPPQSTLGIAKPESFGYLQTQETSLVFNGAYITINNDLYLSSHNIEMLDQSIIEADSKASIEINAENNINIVDGSYIYTTSTSNIDAGDININAQNILLDRQNSGLFTGITSQTIYESSGDTGKINVNAKQLLEIYQGAEISSITSGVGNAKDLTINANKILIDGKDSEYFTGITSQSWYQLSGIASKVIVTVDDSLEIYNGGEISSSTYGESSAKGVDIYAKNIIIDGENSVYHTGISSQAEASSGDAGMVALNVDETIEIKDGGKISSSTFSEGNAGDIYINAENISLDGEGSEKFTGIVSQAEYGSIGNAGKVSVSIDSLLEIYNGSGLSSSTFSQGNAGSVEIKAQNILMDRKNSILFNGVSSQAESGSAGDAGVVTIDVEESLDIYSGSQISSSTFSQGSAGGVDIKAGNVIIDAKDSELLTSISSQAEADSTGDAGIVTMDIDDSIEVYSGAQISSSTFSQGDAGGVDIQAGSILMDGKDAELFTGIISQAEYGSFGDAGKIVIDVNGLLEIYSGSGLSSSTFEIGNAGDVDVKAKNILMDKKGSTLFTGIASQAEPGSTGDAGVVTINVEESLNVYSSSKISSSTFSQGSAGGIYIKTENISINGKDSELLTGIFSQAQSGSAGNAGIVSVNVNNLLEIYSGAYISSSTFSQGDAGDIKIQAKDIIIDKQNSQLFTGVTSQAGYNSTGNAGTVTLNIDNLLEVYGGANISSSTFSQGDAGGVNIQAGNILIDGQGSESPTGIFSQAEYGSLGDAGKVSVSVASLVEIYNGSRISSSTFDIGNAGDVDVQAKNILMDGKDSKLFTGISSQAEADSYGNAGVITINVDESIDIYNGSEISSSTYSDGDAGGVYIYADNIFIDALNSEVFTGITSETISGYGNAGNLYLDVEGSLQIYNGSEVSSSTYAYGYAGSIDIYAQSIIVDGKNSEFFTGISSDAVSGYGDAGLVTINVSGLLGVYNGSEISSSTYTSGNAGGVKIYAGNIIVDSKNSELFTGISSDTISGSGDAGSVSLNVAESLEIFNGANVSSATYTQGNAGGININAKNILMDGKGTYNFTGISSQAAYDSSGQTGDISIQTDKFISKNGAEISIGQYGNQDTAVTTEYELGKLTLKANSISLLEDSFIVAQSTNDAPASLIEIESNSLFLNNSYITSEANYNDAGSITIKNTGLLTLQNSLITTSTNEGNGGDITLKTGLLFMDTGFMQANTNIGASGGDIYIYSDSVITRRSIEPLIGGEKQEFEKNSHINIIQAAAPEGNPGGLTITSPDIDITASLAKLSTKENKIIELVQDECTKTSTNKSSLIDSSKKTDIESYEPKNTLFSNN